jgi:outer membrane lipoprotein-sorting protein
MKASLLSLALVAGLCATARADFTIVQKVEGKASANEITLKLKGDRVRMEATPQMTMIVDGKTGDTITLMNAQKKFLRISGDKDKAIAELAAKYGGNSAEKPKLTATGKKMTINGFEAEEYVGETKSFKASYWIAPSFPDSAAIMKQLQAVIPAAWNDLAKGMMDYRDLPGFPLRTQVKTEDGEITSTVTAIKREPLSDAEFSIPNDFQEMKIPNVKISGDTQPAPSAKP